MVSLLQMFRIWRELGITGEGRLQISPGHDPMTLMRSVFGSQRGDSYSPSQPPSYPWSLYRSPTLSPKSE